MKRFLKFFKVATLVLFAIAVAYTLVIGFFADANVSKMNIANYIVYGAMLTGSAFFIVAYSKKSYLSIHAQTSKDATFKNIRPIWRLLGYMVLWMGACAICVWLATTAETFRDIVLFDETMALFAVFFHWRTKYTLQAVMK